MIVAFEHRHAAHCESGAISALLRHAGVDLSEPMAFGIGGGLFFIHVPFLRMGDIPLTAYRDAPGAIIRRVCRRLDIRLHRQRFRDPIAAMQALDALLARGMPVGLQTSAFWLPYFPPEMRFQFNAHNLIVYGKDGEDYHISDPISDRVVTCRESDLVRARFAKGLYAPKGLLYYPAQIPARPDIARVTRDALRTTAKRMLTIPVPFFGVRGIRRLAEQLPRWPQKYGPARAKVWVGSVVRMQEEIGTGGAGFRFLYAAFLQEAAAVAGITRLESLSQELTAIGDRWREFAVQGALLVKDRASGEATYTELSRLLQDCAAREARLFRDLLEAV
jgi:hypothetical protein